MSPEDQTFLVLLSLRANVPIPESLVDISIYCRCVRISELSVFCEKTLNDDSGGFQREKCDYDVTCMYFKEHLLWHLKCS